ncbi:hypothetical protein DL95DRAFT_484808 [Leptodontidium sp. 2 PMI_412]|nr:hypothetical protein DL95DRAFT_484808 [Leptodontidium sp. 2 PMI_412]
MDPQSGDSLCDFCKRISIETLDSPGGLKHAKVSPWKGQNRRLFLKRGFYPKFSRLVCREGESQANVDEYPLFTDEGDPAVLAGVRVRRRPDHPSSPCSYDTAKAWIQECYMSHGCSPVSLGLDAQSDQIGPARLIDLQCFLGESDDNEEQDICFDRMVKISNTLSTGEGCKCIIRDKISPQWDTEPSQRDWTYQERFLAPRILHFIGTQILWECRENHGIPLESGMELRNVEPLHRIQPFFGPVAKSLLRADTEVKKNDLLKHWYDDVVPEFSKRVLSYGNDKLPAISGIAKVFQERLKYTYIAGLWLEDIETGLCWFRTSETRDAVGHPTDYRAPTWAWPSLNGYIYWTPRRRTRSTRTYGMQVEDYCIEHTGADRLGHISGGWLRLNGFIGHGIMRNASYAGRLEQISVFNLAREDSGK